MGNTLEFSSDGLLNYVIPNLKECIVKLEEAKAKLQNIPIITEIKTVQKLKECANNGIATTIYEVEQIKIFVTNKIEAFEKAQQDSNLKFKSVNIDPLKNARLLAFSSYKSNSGGSSGGNYGGSSGGNSGGSSGGSSSSSSSSAEAERRRKEEAKRRAIQKANNQLASSLKSMTQIAEKTYKSTSNSNSKKTQGDYMREEAQIRQKNQQNGVKYTGKIDNIRSNNNTNSKNKKTNNNGEKIVSASLPQYSSGYTETTTTVTVKEETYKGGKSLDDRIAILENKASKNQGDYMELNELYKKRNQQNSKKLTGKIDPVRPENKQKLETYKNTEKKIIELKSIGGSIASNEEMKGLKKLQNEAEESLDKQTVTKLKNEAKKEKKGELNGNKVLNYLRDEGYEKMVYDMEKALSGKFTQKQISKMDFRKNGIRVEKDR